MSTSKPVPYLTPVTVGTHEAVSADPVPKVRQGLNVNPGIFQILEEKATCCLCRMIQKNCFQGDV